MKCIIKKAYKYSELNITTQKCQQHQKREIVEESQVTVASNVCMFLSSSGPYQHPEDRVCVCERERG